VTVQVLLVEDPAQDVVWDEARAKVEAGWADHLQQDRAEIVSVQTAEQRLLMSLDNLAVRRVVLSVEQE
jgi:hypothetical protein